MSTWRHDYLKKRLWLNPNPRLNASVRSFVSLEFDAADPNGKHSSQRKDRYDLEAEFSVSDCSRIVTLDFNLYNPSPKELREMRAKVERLRAATVDFYFEVSAALDDLENKRQEKPK